MNKNELIDRASTRFKQVSKTDAFHYNEKFKALPYWLDTSSYYFKSEVDNKLPNRYFYFKRGAVIRVNFGVNEGSEFSNLHFAIVLDKKDSPNKKTLTVIPLTSKPGRGRIPLGKEIFNQTITVLEKQIIDFKKQINEMETRFSNLNKISDNLFNEMYQGINQLQTLDTQDSKSLEQAEALKNELNKKIKQAAENNSKLEKMTDTLAENRAKIKKVIDIYKKYNKDSYARLNDITTISKLRIRRINNFDPSGKIRLSSEQMRNISDELMRLYISK